MSDFRIFCTGFVIWGLVLEIVGWFASKQMNFDARLFICAGFGATLVAFLGKGRP